mgnify:CR=1 FL=1
MKPLVSAVLFSDRTIMWCGFDVVSDHVVSGLYDRPEDVSTNPVFHPTVRPRCCHGADCQELCVVGIPTGHGGWWDARACRTCVLLTHGHHPLEGRTLWFASNKNEVPPWARAVWQHVTTSSTGTTRLPDDVPLPKEWFHE